MIFLSVLPTVHMSWEKPSIQDITYCCICIDGL
jgi:hypothetical protein